MKTIVALFLLAASTASAAPQQLTLDAYLEQVNGESPTVAASRLQSEGNALKAQGAEVLTFPYLFGGFSSAKDQSETAFPAFQGTGTVSDVYNLGIGYNTPWGVNAKYSWNTTYANVEGTSFPYASPYTSYNRIDLTLNLVRNGLGSETNSRKELIRAGSQAQSLASGFELVGKLAEAESLYWRLAVARATVEIERETLNRSETLLQWAKKRVGNQLGDRSDFLQAQSNYDLKVLELQNAIEEEKNSARAFNLMRNQPGERVPESLGMMSVDSILRAPRPNKYAERLDSQAAAERSRAAKAQAQLDKESVKPTLDVVASYAWNGRDAKGSGAISEALKSGHPYKAIGVNFTVPLNVPNWTNAIKGGNKSIEAADYELEQVRIAETMDWQALNTRLDDARKRLELTRTVENVQREKFEHERQRLRSGRTTTFQTLTFEQDLAQASIIRLRTQAEVLQILAQMKTYRGKQ